MPRVGVFFELRRAWTVPGEMVRVAGGGAALGGWEPLGRGSDGLEQDALMLRTGPVRYPRWCMREPVWIEFEEQGQEEESISELVAAGRTRCSTRTLQIEYKYLKDLRQTSGGGGNFFHWEDGIENRRAHIPREPESIWLVSDVQWDVRAPPRVTSPLQSYAIDTPRAVRVQSYAIGTPKEMSSSAAESELKAKMLSDEKLAAEKAASELSAEVRSLQRESALLKADKERAEGLAKALRAEVGGLTDTVMSLAQSVEAASSEHAGRAERMRREGAELRAENSELREAVTELRQELLEGAAAALPTEPSKQPSAEQAREPMEEPSPQGPGSPESCCASEDSEPFSGSWGNIAGPSAHFSRQSSDFSRQESIDLERQLSEARSSLNAVTPRLQEKQDRPESELMKVLCRRRELCQG